MRYFIGASPQRFATDAGSALIRGSAYSLENLKGAPNKPAQPCLASAPPCFHTGAVVVIIVVAHQTNIFLFLLNPVAAWCRSRRAAARTEHRISEHRASGRQRWLYHGGRKIRLGVARPSGFMPSLFFAAPLVPPLLLGLAIAALSGHTSLGDCLDLLQDLHLEELVAAHLFD